MDEREFKAWDDTLVAIQKSACSCGCTETKSIYNQHDGDYATYDRTCVKCGKVLLSLLD